MRSVEAAGVVDVSHGQDFDDRPMADPRTDPDRQRTGDNDGGNDHNGRGRQSKARPEPPPRCRVRFSFGNHHGGPRGARCDSCNLQERRRSRPDITTNSPNSVRGNPAVLAVPLKATRSNDRSDRRLVRFDHTQSAVLSPHFVHIRIDPFTIEGALGMGWNAACLLVNEGGPGYFGEPARTSARTCSNSPRTALSRRPDCPRGRFQL